MVFYIDGKKEESSREISCLLKKCIQVHTRKWSELVFLCIGSDRMTGDCLGPYIGQKLSSYEWNGIFVYGTLSDPVHALNLEKICTHIRQKHPKALVIAIDACLGEK